MTVPEGVLSSRFTLLVRWAIVLALASLLISMATGQAGIANYLELRDRKNDLLELKQELLVKNQMLRSRINELKTSRESQLHYLKASFGYVESGEVVYHFEARPKVWREGVGKTEATVLKRPGI